MPLPLILRAAGGIMFLSCPCTCVCMCMCVLAWQRYPPTRLPLTCSLVSIMCIVPSQCCATDVAALDAGSCVLPLSLQTTIPLVKLQLFIFYLFFAVSYGGVWTHYLSCYSVRMEYKQNTRCSCNFCAANGYCLSTGQIGH